MPPIESRMRHTGEIIVHLAMIRLILARQTKV
jgi:hypothetical protein